MSGSESASRVGAVVIGRNEGERLRRCLVSARAQTPIIVYVDSGSSDGSVELARAAGTAVVELDPALPFTAARARNEGLGRLRAIAPRLEWVLFVDGDCELVEGFVARALPSFADARVAVAAGRRRERNPRHSLYNLLCDMEWDTPVGVAEACGGDALMRIEAVEQVGGYDASLIAGEEPDLCLRLRRQGWTILRIPVEMTLHDAAMDHFRQWWRRNLRGGHAIAEGRYRQRSGRERFWVREARSNWFWGALLPLFALALAPLSHGATLVLFLGYPVLIARILARGARPGFRFSDRVVYAAACASGKLPQACGQLQYHWNRLRRRKTTLIEYKSAS